MGGAHFDEQTASTRVFERTELLKQPYLSPNSNVPLNEDGSKPGAGGDVTEGLLSSEASEDAEESEGFAAMLPEGSRKMKQLRLSSEKRMFGFMAVRGGCMGGGRWRRKVITVAEIGGKMRRV